MAQILSCTGSLLVVFSVTFSVFAVEEAKEESFGVKPHSMTKLPVPYSDFSDSEDSQKTSSSQPLEGLLSAWRGNLEKLPSEPTRSDVRDAFEIARGQHLDALRSPVRIGGQPHIFPHGVSPQKDTPRRQDNIKRLADGEPPIFVNPITDKVETLHGHHVAQDPDDTIVYIPRSFHQGASRDLHRFNADGTKIDRSEFSKQKRKARKRLAERLQSNDYSPGSSDSDNDVDVVRQPPKVRRIDSPLVSSCRF